MDTKDEIRRRRLKQHCDQSGGVQVVAARAGLNPATLDQIIKGVLLPKKADGTRSKRTLGNEAAEAIEKAYGLHAGWFDWPFENVDFNDWAGLNERQRGFVEGKLQIALQDAQKMFAPKKPKPTPAKAKGEHHEI